MPAPVSEPQCVVELANARGATMRLQLRGNALGGLPAPVPRVLERVMIQITPHMRILVAVEPIDFRAGIDGLVAACVSACRPTPSAARCSSFGNRARTAIKVLVYDGQGFWMCHKRLSSGHFAFWPDAATPSARAAGVRAAGAAHGRATRRAPTRRRHGGAAWRHRAALQPQRARAAPAAARKFHGSHCAAWADHVLGVLLQRLQILEGVDTAQPRRCGSGSCRCRRPRRPVARLVEHRVLAMQDGALQGPLAHVVVQRRAGLAQEQRQRRPSA